MKEVAVDSLLAFCRNQLSRTHEDFTRNVESLTLDEALFAAGGYRSMLGVAKHLAGWLHVYRSYAFDDQPRHWAQTAWPRGLIDTIEPTESYLREVLAWVDAGFRAWDAHLAQQTADRPAKLHWGQVVPLSDIVMRTVSHVNYHGGELNMLLSIARAEAWEYTEEVEENHVSTYGHGVPAAWMTGAQRGAYEERLRIAAEDRRSGT
jgi:uncharacterized damage-inducible protein DinB